MRIFSILVLASLGIFISPSVLPAAPAATSTLSAAEATIIATRFFAEEIRLEGSVASPSLQADYWAFPIKIGYAGFVLPDPILVHRYTGETSWAGLAKHKAFLQSVKAGALK